MYSSATTPTRIPAPPTVHERALITWASIFPLVSLTQWALTPLMDSWPAVLRAFAVTLVVVPLAVYVIVPRLTDVYLRCIRRR